MCVCVFDYYHVRFNALTVCCACMRVKRKYQKKDTYTHNRTKKGVSLGQKDPKEKFKFPFPVRRMRADTTTADLSLSLRLAFWHRYCDPLPGLVHWPICLHAAALCRTNPSGSKVFHPDANKIQYTRVYICTRLKVKSILSVFSGDYNVKVHWIGFARALSEHTRTHTLHTHAHPKPLSCRKLFIPS